MKTKLSTTGSFLYVMLFATVVIGLSLVLSIAAYRHPVAPERPEEVEPTYAGGSQVCDDRMAFIVIRSSGREYVMMNNIVFCWDGTNLVGVFNTVSTNSPALENAK